MTKEETAVIVADLANQEGREPNMYLDTADDPRVTWGIGVMFPTAEAAARSRVPWQNVTANRPATHDEVIAEWQRVHAMPHLRVASFYRGHSAPIVETALEDADAYCANELETVIYPDLREVFVGFDVLPLNARRALVDIRWNVGPGKFATETSGGTGVRAFVHLRAALLLPSVNYEAAALACSRVAKTAHAKARNLWTAGMFRSCEQQ